MSKKLSLAEIIYKKNLCIRYNPLGIFRLWPYSYIEKFYNAYCEDLYHRNNSPNILEINQSNNLNIILWKNFFNDPKLDNLTTKNILSNSNKILIKYDMIILKDKYLINNNKTFNILIKLLKNDGIIVIENIGRNYKKIIKLYFENFRNFGIKILDYRFNRFILDNCILIIRKQNNKNMFQKLKELFLLFKFIIFEITISFILIILRRLKNY